jgi:hypothetical protein
MQVVRQGLTHFFWDAGLSGLGEPGEHLDEPQEQLAAVLELLR